jgi:hypothetical protein
MDVVRLQPFARVIATLAQESTEISAERPPFNPLNLFAGNNDIISADAASLIYDADVEGEIAVRETPSPTIMPRLIRTPFQRPSGSPSKLPTLRVSRLAKTLRKL